MADIHELPSTGERHKVADTLRQAGEENYDQVVLLGFKDGKTFLLHSKIENIPLLIGSIEWLKHRLMEKGGVI